MFNGAQNVVVEGGSFEVTVDSSKKVDIGRLFDMVAPNAILNAGGRADEVRCFPGTREEVIDKVEKWADSIMDGTCKNRIMWLSGPAGAGKSAICQTIAERCPARGQQAANFFFFREDQTRNRAQPLVPTLIYQLRRIYPILDDLLTSCLTTDPLIWNAPLADQFLHLISSPMQTVRQSTSTRETVILVIDGLDECDGSRKQDEILVALRALVNADHSPFLALVASRAEPQLVMSFNRLGTSVESIFLDDQYRPQDDIRRFVTAKFDEIKRDHHLGHMLSKNWPPKSAIDAITNKSSGQFIYGATVMRFIEHSVESPDLTLAMILSVKPLVGSNPFAQLDAAYSYIFSKVDNIQAIKLILGASLIVDKTFHQHQHMMNLIGYTPVEIKSLLANLTALARFDDGLFKLVFYHASLHDYLSDQSRSGDYHLDLEVIGVEVSTLCFKNFWDNISLSLAIDTLQHVPEATNELTNALLGASTRVMNQTYEPYDYYWPDLFLPLERLYLETDEKLFKTLLQSWVRFSFMNHLHLQPHREEMGTVLFWYCTWYRSVEEHKFVPKIN